MIAVAGAVGLLYGAPASVIPDGDELTAISWVLASKLGPGAWKLYPMTFSISVDDGETTSVIDRCIETSLPGIRLPDGIPFPAVYSVHGDTVTIVFDEVPL